MFDSFDEAALTLNDLYDTNLGIGNSYKLDVQIFV